MHWCHPREESWVHAATVRELADPIEVLYSSCNGEPSGISLLSVACVSHELHARKILDEDDYEYDYNIIIIMMMNKWTNGVLTVDRAFLSRALQLDFLGSHILYSVS